MNTLMIALVIYLAVGTLFGVLVLGSDLVHHRELTWDFVIWFIGWGILVFAMVIGLFRPSRWS